MEKNEIGAAIRRERKKAGLTQEELADRLDITRSLIGQYERGVRNPKASTIQRIADALGINTLQLAPGPENQDPEERSAAAKENGSFELLLSFDQKTCFLRAPEPTSLEGLADFLSKSNALPWLAKAFCNTSNTSALIEALNNTVKE